MQYLLRIVLDSMFPPSTESVIVRALTRNIIQQQYSPHYFDSIQALSAYQNKTTQALIHEAKFHHNAHAWALLNSLLMVHVNNVPTSIDYIIPVPLSSARLRARGYNQVTEILKAGSLHTSHTILTDVLVRTRNTQPQTELKQKDRLTNMRGAFSIVHGERISHKHILLIDDVTTTGTTLLTAKAALLPYSPASIACIALAH